MAIDVEACYQRYGPMVMRRCRRLLGDEQRAADALQDSFVALLEHAPSLDARGLSSLLWRIATNVCLNQLRASRRRPEVRDADLLHRLASADPGGEEQAGSRQLLDRLFGRYPVSTHTLAVLHLVDGWTLEEVAHEVELSVSGVRKRLRRLRADLHELEGV